MTDTADNMEGHDIPIKELAQTVQALRKTAINALALFATVSFGFGVWVTKLQLDTNKAKEDAAHAKGHVEGLELWQAKADADRYTARDHALYATALQEQHNGTDKRVTRLEDSMGRINASLERIETRLLDGPRK